MEQEVISTYNLFHFTGHNSDLLFLKTMERCSDQPSQNVLHAQSLFLAHLLLEILQKIIFLKLIKLFSGHCLATISQNAVCELSTSQSLLFQMQSIIFQHFDHAQIEKFQAIF